MVWFVLRYYPRLLLLSTHTYVHRRISVVNLFNRWLPYRPLRLFLNATESKERIFPSLPPSKNVFYFFGFDRGSPNDSLAHPDRYILPLSPTLPLFDHFVGPLLLVSHATLLRYPSILDFSSLTYSSGSWLIFLLTPTLNSSTMHVTFSDYRRCFLTLTVSLSILPLVHRYYVFSSFILQQSFFPS